MANLLLPDPETIPVTHPDDEIRIALWAPLPGPQTLAYVSEADELFYGGGGGGGKTDLGLGCAVTQHRSSIIFRREFSQFRGPEGIIERSRQIIGNHGELNASVFMWRGLPGGRKIEFGAVKHEDDKNKYKGRAHDLKVFDELPEFSETQYRFLIAWLRTTVPTQRTRVIATGNPPTTAEGEWVLRYWAPWLDPRHPNPAKPGELRWFATVGNADHECAGPEPVTIDGRTVQPRSRTFIPASVEDNPYLMGTKYADVLDNLPDELRKQMRHGDFTVTQSDHPWQVIPTAWIRAAQERWMQRARPTTPLTQVGCDPARGGPDKFCTAKRYDNWLDKVDRRPGSTAPDGDAAARILLEVLAPDIKRLLDDQRAEAAAKKQPVPVDTKKDGKVEAGATLTIDVGGSAGSSAYDTSRKLIRNVVAFNGSEASTARDRSGKLGFFNKRAAAHWRMREILDPAYGEDFALPPDPELLADLSAPRWSLTTRGILVEKKEEIKKRIGRSPDVGEAAIYSCAQDTVGVKVW